MNRFKAVIFDIDGTLTPHISWYEFTRRLGASVDEHRRIYEMHVAGTIDGKLSRKKIIDMWIATGKTNRDEMEQIFSSIPLRTEAKPLVDWVQKQGMEICLISGALDLFAEAVAKQLGVTDYYASSRLFFDKDNTLFDWEYSDDQGEDKLKHLKEFCQKKDLKLNECVPIGDSPNDVTIFEATGNGILLNDGQDTEPIRKSAWEVVTSLSEIPKLLSK